MSQQQAMTSTLVLDSDSQDVPDSCSASSASEDDLESVIFDFDDDDKGETSCSEEESEDDSDVEGRISPEVDRNDGSFDLFNETQEPCLLVAQHSEVLEPFIPIKSFSGYPLVTRHKGYRLCGDNIDKSVHRRHLRIDRQNLSLHYFHTYAVENRIDFTELSDENREGLYVNLSIDDKHSMAAALLPTPQDDQVMKHNISILISRVLATHLKFFKLSFADLIEWHITHKHYSEMSSRSCVVSLTAHNLKHVIMLISPV